MLSGRNRFGSIRFGSTIFEQNLVWVRFGLAIVLSGSMRFGMRCLTALRFGQVRFDSVPRPLPAGSRTKRFGLVRPVRFGSVSYSFLILCYLTVCYVILYVLGQPRPIQRKDQFANPK